MWPVAWVPLPCKAIAGSFSAEALVCSPGRSREMASASVAELPSPSPSARSQIPVSGRLRHDLYEDHVARLLREVGVE